MNWQDEFSMLEGAETVKVREGTHEIGVHLIRASEIEPERVEYLDEGLIPLRVVTLVTGLDGVGKSTILYAKAALATLGKLPGQFKGLPVEVVIASSEDHPASVIVPRLMAAGGDLSRVHVVKVARDGLSGEISFPDDLDDVAAEVHRVNARLLIVDPLVAHMPLHIDSHKAQHVRAVLAPLARLAETAGLAVAAVVHFNGAPSTDVRSRISGSKALRDAARSVLVCGPDPNDESRFVLVQDKHSFGPKENTGHTYRIECRSVEHKGETYDTSGVVWLGDVEIDSRGLLAGPADPEERTNREEARDFLLDVLPKDGTPADSAAVKEAADREGIKESTLHRARRALGVIVERSGFAQSGSSASTWRLPLVSPPGGTNEGDMSENRDTSVAPQGDSTAESPSGARSCHPRETDTSAGNGHVPSGWNGRLPSGWTTGPIAACFVCGSSVAARDPDDRTRHPRCDPDHVLRVARLRAEVVRDGKR